MTTLLGVVTAASAVIVAITGLVAAVKGLMPLLHEQRKATAAVAEVHDLVNDRLDRQITRNEQLTRALTAANVAVPPADQPPAPGGHA